MEAAFSWIGKLFEFFGSLFPRLLIVMVSHRAVKYVCGKNVVLLQPGLHIYWPFVTEVEICPVVPQILNLHNQILETSDGIPVLVGGLIKYEIISAIKFLAENENSYQSIDDISTAAIRRVINEKTLQEIRDYSVEIDDEITNAIQEHLDAYGVKIEYARLTDFSKTKVLHVSGIQEKYWENGVHN
jgi:regulator of protease activity HflC (stomatin/prohibitin superfamily)